MHITDSYLQAEIDYRAERVRADWRPRRHRRVRRGHRSTAATPARRTP